MKRVLMLGLCSVAMAFAAARLLAPAPERTAGWTDPVSGIDFINVPAGTFVMGTPPDEPGREAEEVAHEVTLTRPFYLGKYEVTQAQWTRIMGGNPSAFPACGSRCPVERVNFHDVEAFIARLNERAGPGFRLPTEAEWEYACRAGGTEPFGHSSSLSSRDANIDGEYPYRAPKGTARETTTPVGYFPPNAWGFHDLAGNVWEWTADWHCPYTAGAVTDPIGACASQVPA